MPLLRLIRKSRWRPQTWPTWLKQDDFRADAFLDLQTEKDGLSFWTVEQNHANLDRLIAALAANRDTLSDVDYALVERDDLEQIGVKLIEIDGDTPDAEVNKQYHLDVAEISGARLFEIAKLIHQTNRLERNPEKQVGALVAEGLKRGQLATEQMKETLVQKIRSKYG